MIVMLKPRNAHKIVENSLILYRKEKLIILIVKIVWLIVKIVKA